MSAVIAYLFGIIFFLWFAKTIFNLVRAIVLRVSFYVKLKEICRVKGYAITLQRTPFASFFSMSKKSDLIVDTGGTRYSVRLLTCFAHKRAYHFINERYYVCFARFGYVLPMSKNINKIRFFESLKKLPKLSDERNENTKQILIFNPSPIEIYQLEDSRINKSLVTNGSEMYGWLVYGASGFLNLINSN